MRLRWLGVILFSLITAIAICQEDPKDPGIDECSECVVKKHEEISCKNCKKRNERNCEEISDGKCPDSVGLCKGVAYYYCDAPPSCCVEDEFTQLNVTCLPPKCQCIAIIVNNEVETTVCGDPWVD